MTISAATAAIDVRDLSFRIGGTEILGGISFTALDGEYLSIVGPNGAGKTTLLRCLVRVIVGFSGHVSVMGQPLQEYSQKELARLVSYVPQSDGRWFPYTGRQFVLMGRYPHLSPFANVGGEDLDAVEEALELTGTSDLADRDIRTLSGGERQKIMIAAALSQGSRIMLLDEPTTFLDPKHADDVTNILLELNGSGVTILSVTHDINNAAVSSSNVLALKEGNVVFHGPTHEFMDNSILQALYDKSFRIIEHPDTGMSVVLPGEGGT